MDYAMRELVVCGSGIVMVNKAIALKTPFAGVIQ